MAGDWLKMRIDLQSHPKVVRILSATHADKFRVIGGLHAVWSVFDTHSEDGRLKGYTPAALDHIIGWEGFSDAMIAVKWLAWDGDETLSMPEFTEHNGSSAKRRAEDQKRKRDERKRPQDVRTESGQNADELRTREEREKRERESKATRPPRKAAGGTPLFSEDSIPMKAARHLFALMRQNNAGAKEPNWQAWAKEIDLILRVDKRDPHELRKIIDWCQRDSFWRVNVLSPKTLRKQYDRLALAMKAPTKRLVHEGPPGAPHHPSLRDAL